jgi:hypothetical protein
VRTCGTTACRMRLTEAASGWDVSSEEWMPGT